MSLGRCAIMAVHAASRWQATTAGKGLHVLSRMA